MESQIYFEKFTDKARQLFQRANLHAQVKNHTCIGSEHILYGLLDIDGDYRYLLEHQRVGVRQIKLNLEKVLVGGPSPDFEDGEILPETTRGRVVCQNSCEEAANLVNGGYVDTGHIFLALLRDEGIAQAVLSNQKLSYKPTRELVTNRGYLDNRKEKLLGKETRIMFPSSGLLLQL